MRRGTLIGVVLLILVAAVAAVWFTNRPESPEGNIPDGAVAATVTYVHDGDTLYLDDGSREMKVRLIGLDAPELADRDTDEECFGPEATGILRTMLPEGTEVWVTHDVEAQDRYGRELLYVFKEDGTFVNHALVLAGAGVAIRVGANDRYWPQLQEAEADARTAGAGMWGVCPVP